MHANIVEQGYHLETCISRVILPPLNSYSHLAMKDAIVLNRLFIGLLVKW